MKLTNFIDFLGYFPVHLLTTLFILRFSLSDKRVASSKLKIFVRDLHNSSTTTSGKNFLITCEKKFVKSNSGEKNFVKSKFKTNRGDIFV